MTKIRIKTILDQISNGLARWLVPLFVKVQLARKVIFRFWIYAAERNNHYYISILQIRIGVACEQSKASV
jgi:hypothetical protein